MKRLPRASELRRQIPACRHASYTMMATVFDRFRLRFPGISGRRRRWSVVDVRQHFRRQSARFRTEDKGVAGEKLGAGVTARCLRRQRKQARVAQHGAARRPVRDAPIRSPTRRNPSRPCATAPRTDRIRAVRSGAVWPRYSRRAELHSLCWAGSPGRREQHGTLAGTSENCCFCRIR